MTDTMEAVSTMTYDQWKAHDRHMLDADPDQPDELELCYAALHQALESKCVLIKALQQIKDGLANLEDTPGRRDFRWMSRSTKHDMWRVARDALISAGVKS